MSKTREESNIVNLSPEQQANLKRFGKKNGASEKLIQSQLPPSIQSVVRQQPPIVQSSQPQQPQQPILQSQPIEVQERSLPTSTEYSDCDTYFSFAEKNGSNLEIDLITFREKGIETRYLSIMLNGQDVRQDPPTPQSAFLSIDSKEEFEKLKSFFVQLEWED